MKMGRMLLAACRVPAAIQSFNGAASFIQLELSSELHSLLISARGAELALSALRADRLKRTGRSLQPPVAKRARPSSGTLHMLPCSTQKWTLFAPPLPSISLSSCRSCPSTASYRHPSRLKLGSYCLPKHALDLTSLCRPCTLLLSKLEGSRVLRVCWKF